MTTRRTNRFFVHALVALGVSVRFAIAGVGDPQIRTDHPWYPGELAYSAFKQLFVTEAEQYERRVVHAPRNDQENVLASWCWRNTHYARGEEVVEDLWGTGFAK